MENVIKIAPSILSADFANLGKEIQLLDDSGCDYIHIDIMDGHFVPNLTIGPDVISSIRNLTKKIFDVHLMIDPVKEFIPNFINAGADIITIHHEIGEDVFECIELIKKFGKKAGISIKPKTDANEIEKYLDLVDLILIMTVEPGFGGQKFITSQINKIKEIKKIVSNKKIEIEVDGGINEITAKQVIDAGANVLVSGSTIFKYKDYAEIIEVLRGK
ncbi:MAG: ribulose-phosphate 3-epimerase [Rickettsiales bacterium]|nr:ribulose-phosphate 3-epimerase [Rickettsiales bacterium]|tara:strand:- start:17 stop:667 length:651 start_codon:yes stop_codon:yes gene_type:complete